MDSNINFFLLSGSSTFSLHFLISWVMRVCYTPHIFRDSWWYLSKRYLWCLWIRHYNWVSDWDSAGLVGEATVRFAMLVVTPVGESSAALSRSFFLWSNHASCASYCIWRIVFLRHLWIFILHLDIVPPFDPQPPGGRVLQSRGLCPPP